MLMRKSNRFSYARDDVMRIVKRSGWSYSEIELESEGEIRVQTLYNWSNGSVLNPQHSKMLVVLEVLGYTFEIVEKASRVKRKAA